jgi:phosphotransferase family enzyme
MKTLPDNPNLDHLRRQAKDLLAGLRESRPGATLADAQASIAEQYGFRTWTGLKAEADRRRGTAEIADPALARRIAARFGLGEVTGPMRSMARADEVGRLWSLATDRGRWTPRTVDGVYPVTDGEADARFQETAARAGVTLPAPVRSAAGAVTEAVDGHRWRVHAWVSSGPPLAAPVSADITRAVGAVLATLHGLRYPADRLCPWSSVRFETRSWEELAEVAAGRNAGWAPALAVAAPVLTGLQAVGVGSAPGEHVLCHNNLNPGNVRIGAGGRPVVSGWEHASGLPPAWELSSALVNWAVDPNGGINAAGARALLEGYREKAGALPELSLATFRGSATALMNYVAGQVDRALDAAGDQDSRHFDRTVRHLLTHLPSRATYEQLLTATAAG